MRAYDAATLAALKARAFVIRDTLRVVAKNRATGAAVVADFWSGEGQAAIDVVDPDTGASVSRSCVGSGTLIQASEVVATSNVTVQTTTITLSQIVDAIDALVKNYDLKFGRVELHRAFFDPLSHLQLAPAVCRFVGLVDKAERRNPSENEAGGLTLTCVSHTQEMTRANAAKRSDADQRLRGATDNFYADVSTVGEQELSWGQYDGSIPKDKPKKKKLLGIF